MPRILFISPEFIPTGRASAEAQVNLKLVTAGLNAGWKIDVIAEDQDLTSSHSVGDILGGAMSNIVSLVHIPDRTTFGHLLLRIRSQMLFRGMFSLYGNAGGPLAFRKGLELLRTNRYDIIMSRAFPEYAHLAALMLARKTGIPWIANSNDPTPMRLAPPPYGEGPFGKPPGGWLMGGVRQHCLKRYFSAVTREATWHTFPCERLRKYMGNLLGESLYNKSSVIPHIALGSFKTAQSPQKGLFSLCYAGNLHTYRNPEVFLKGLKIFLESVMLEDRVKVTFLGQHCEAAKRSAASIKLEDIVSVEPGIPYQDAVERVGSSSIALIIEGQMKEGIFLPSKLVDCAQTGRPILAVSPLNGTLSDLIGEYGGGIVADCFSPESVASALGVLYASWKKGNLDREYGPQRLAAQFGEKRVITAYEELFASILLPKS